MDINKGLLFLDGVAATSTAKILDLGFNGDFDYKNTAWNRLFAAFPVTSSGTALTIKVFTCDSEYDASASYAVGDLVMKDGVMYRCTTAITGGEAWTAGHWSTTLTDSALASLVIPQASVRAGGAYAFPMPVGLKRYVTVVCSAVTAPSKVTVGITNDVDTDAIALGGGINWTYYKAKTLGTALKGTPIQNVAEVIASGSDAEGVAAAAVAAHAALTSADGVHGLTT